MKRIVIGISGASGAIYGIRLLQVLQHADGLETHLLLTSAAKQTVLLETDYDIDSVKALADKVYSINDIAACVSSGSYETAGMIVAPCSIKTLSGVANSSNDNLLTRAADVTLKEQRKLVLLLRETPLHIGHMRLMQQAAEAGAIVMPAMPAFYHKPKTIDDLINQLVNRALDQVGIKLKKELFERWNGPEYKPNDERDVAN